MTRYFNTLEGTNGYVIQLNSVYLSVDKVAVVLKLLALIPESYLSGYTEESKYEKIIGTRDWGVYD